MKRIYSEVHKQRQRDKEMNGESEREMAKQMKK